MARYPAVCLASANPKGQKYVSVSSRAEIQNDREKIKELFAIPAKAWWNSPDDPSIRVLKVTPSFAEYWDSPGAVISYIKMAAACIIQRQARPWGKRFGKVLSILYAFFPDAGWPQGDS
jgi:hypothetical protein